MSNENDKEDGRDPKTKQFTFGNRFWLRRSSAGRKPKFTDPEVLWKCACEYFEYTSSTPLFEDKVGFYEGTATHEPCAKMQPFTILGLCIFLDINQDTWADWRKNRADLSEIITMIENVIKTQKFNAAAAGLLNANIISRDLGLADKAAIQALDKDGEPTDLPTTTDASLAFALEAARKVDGA